MKILFQGWINIPHSYAIVFCFTLIHLFKKYKDKIEFYIQEEPYYQKKWENIRKINYGKEYNDILSNFKRYNGEPIDLIYRHSYPFNIIRNDSDKMLPICVFYTSEYLCLSDADFKFIGNINDALINCKNFHFFTPSQWSSNSLDIIGKFDNKILRHGVDTSIFYHDISKRKELRQQLHVSDDDILLTHLGAMTANKGSHIVIVVFDYIINKLHDKRFKLLLKGSSELYDSVQHIRDYFTRFGIQGNNASELLKNIIFIDKMIEFDDIRHIYNATDLYLAPYLAEGFNLPVLEALACGTKVLVPRTGSTVEFIKDISNNGGSDFITIVNSIITVADGHKFLNHIDSTELAMLIYQNYSKYKMELDCTKMCQYINEQYSWNKVSELLYNYFVSLVGHE